jgi:MFS superfamily sulfate permease-like transporter
VAGLLLPEAVAYAGIAHLPVAHALVACLAGLVVYASAGASRDAIVAPTSSSASLAAAAALSLPVAGALGYAQTLVALTLAAGVVLLLLAVARQGQLSAFVSRPVLRGFAFALALTIVVRQLPDALGVTPAPEVPPDPLHLLVHLLVRWREWHPISLGLAVIAGGLITLLRRWPQWPASLIVLVLAVWLGWGLNLSAWGVAEVGVVPEPTWTLAWPRFTLDTWLRVSELAVGLVVLLFAESWGAMRSLALVRGDTLNPNRELLALGLANVASGLLNGMPVGAGFSASMANHGAGAKSRKAGLIAFALIALAVAVALPALRFLPRPVLAVAVIGALWHALSPRPLLATWRLGRDRLLIVGAVSAVLVIGLLHGMLAAVALSIVEALRRFSQPLVDELGELAETRNFVALDEHGEARPVPGLLVLRPQEPLFFASAERTMAEVAQRLSAAQAQTLVLSLEDSTDLDSTALECLLELDTRLRRSGRRLVLARAKERVRALLRLAAPQGLGQDACLFWSVADAVEAVRYTAAGDSSAKP